jgi:hemoglobin
MLSRILSVIVIVGVAGCALHPASMQRDGDDLYQALGGESGITAIVDQFLWNLADDERINAHFVETNVARFRTKLIEQFCELSGGPCAYTGDTMKLSHGGMGIDHADFNALVEALIEAMEAHDVATGPQNRLLALLAPMHAEIIEEG